MKLDGEINKVEDAIDIIRDLVKEVNNPNTQDSFLNFVTKDNFLHGFWFRGEKFDEKDENFKPLNPSIFRLTDNDKYQSETTIFNYLPTINEKLRSFSDPFDRLSHMQHYDIPTRLLDWSDSILTSLYFAVSSGIKKKSPSRLYVLNAAALNEITCFRKAESGGNIHNTVDFGVRFRNAFLTSENLNQFKNYVHNDSGLNGINSLKNFNWAHKDINRNFHKLFDFKEHTEDYNQYEKCLALSTPIAVYPNRINHRLIFQNGLFTYHGGKLNGKTEGNILPKPYDLINLNSEEVINRTKQKVLKVYEIPYDSKENIQKDLLNLRIHQGSLFPELDKQVNFVKLISKLP